MNMKYLMCLLIFAATCSAQERSHFKRYVVTQIALEGADAFFTRNNICRYDWVHCSAPRTTIELNPIARPFVQGSALELSAYFSAEAAVKIGSAYLAHRRHSRMERWIEISGMGSSAAGVAMSAHAFAKGN